MGRPSKATPETVQILIEATHPKVTLAATAAFAGIDYKTLNRWRKKGEAGDPRFTALAKAIYRRDLPFLHGR
jgi:hypothetical protein